MDSYQARKEARRSAYAARHGKPQARRVFRVYASVLLGYLPERFANLPVGAFSSRKEADEFTRDTGPGTMYGSQARKALSHMISREESMKMPPGWDAYLRFEIRSEKM